MRAVSSQLVRTTPPNTSASFSRDSQSYGQPSSPHTLLDLRRTSQTPTTLIRQSLPTINSSVLPPSLPTIRTQPEFQHGGTCTTPPSQIWNSIWKEAS